MKAPKTFEFAVAKTRTTWITLTPMNIRINSHTKRANIPPPAWEAQCILGAMHTADMTIIERWWRIFAAGFGYALH